MRILFLYLMLSSSFISIAQNLVKMKECIIEAGVLKEIEVDYDRSTGERSFLRNGIRKKFHDVYTAKGRDYADGQPWYVNNEAVSFNGKRYVKYGLPRILSPSEINKSGIYNSVGVYTEAGLTGMPDVIYIPVRQGCEFQPYQLSCGSVFIEQVTATASSVHFRAKPSGLTGTISYTWEPLDAKIIQGQGTASITVDTRNRKDGEKINLSVTATDAKKCRVNAYTDFVVKNPGTKATGTSKWTETDRKLFMEDCIESTGFTAEAGRAYCSCMMEKIIKLHPDPLTVDKELSEDWIKAEAEKCLSTK